MPGRKLYAYRIWIRGCSDGYACLSDGDAAGAALGKRCIDSMYPHGDLAVSDGNHLRKGMEGIKGHAAVDTDCLALLYGSVVSDRMVYRSGAAEYCGRHLLDGSYAPGDSDV